MVDERVVIGTSLGHYRISDRLGAGGMGVVYRARDERLARDVAVKILPETFAADAGRVKRFEQEARAAAALDHPNILAVHDVGTCEDVPYIVTELLEGETLRDRLSAGDLTPRNSVEIASQIARGLAAAHDRGIVHRDLKPDNVFITSDGTVKLLDFGLAKLTQLEAPLPEITGATTGPPPTASGTVLGTVGYMSPEQVRGRSADHRADIFAFGCVLYEMLSGRRAFKGATPADTAAAILSSDPEPLSEVNSQLPSGLETIVERCLQKRPEDRFQSIRDVAFALQAAAERRAGRRAGGARWVSLRLPVWRLVAGAVVAGLGFAAYLALGRLAPAVLPEAKHLGVVAFTAAENDPDDRALAEGLTDNLVQALSVIEQDVSAGVWVVPPREATQLGVTTAREFGRKFNVTLAVAGRLRRRGGGYRFELNVSEPTSDRVVRSAVIEDSAGNVSFQQEPALRLADLLGISLSQRARERLAAATTTMPGVFSDFLDARSRLAHATSAQEVDGAVAAVQHAVEADPLFAPGWVTLARAWLARHHYDHDQASIERGLEAAAHAQKLAGRPELAWRAAADLHSAAGHHEEAIAALERAAETAPNDAEIRLELAGLYAGANRLDDAEGQVRRAIYLRPGYWVGYDRMGKLYYAQGRYEAAVTEFRHVIACAPEFALGYVKVGSMMYFLERENEARRYFERSVEVEPTYLGLSNLATLDFNDSHFADAAATYERALKLDDSNYAVWGYLGYAWRYAGATEKAETAFRRAVQMGEAELAKAPGDVELVTYVAGFHAMLGERERGLELIDQVLAAPPTNPQLIASIAECLWDLGQRDRAIEWVGRAFATGSIPRSRFEGRPTLRDLVADERYQALAQKVEGVN